MKTYVLYHANCSDGFCAAWVARKVHPSAEFIPVQYGQDPPEMEPGSNVLIVDFSYKKQVMVDLASKMQFVRVLDHHKTAAEELVGLDGLYSNLSIEFDMTKSGGRLTWECYFHGDRSPWLVDYTEDRDLWQWKLPHSRAVSAALRSYEFSFQLWDELALVKPEELAKEGEAILRYQDQVVKDHVKHARLMTVGGHEVLTVNATVLFSEIAGVLAKGQPFGACYFDRQDGKRQWSLRSTSDGADVSEVAKALGGGGHKHAAGFETQL